MDIKLRCVKTYKAHDIRSDEIRECFTKDKIYDAKIGKVNSIVAIDNYGDGVLVMMSPEIKQNRQFFSSYFVIKSPYQIRQIYKRGVLPRQSKVQK